MSEDLRPHNMSESDKKKYREFYNEYLEIGRILGLISIWTEADDPIKLTIEYKVRMILCNSVFDYRNLYEGSHLTHIHQVLTDRVEWINKTEE